VAVLHDVSLACAFADQVLLLRDGRVLETSPASSLSAGALESLYGVPMSAARSEGGQPLFSPRTPG
jgi:iron complex transport system ATP-binding protein